MGIFETIKYFLINTPWYVYLILFYLIKIGVRSIKSSIISIKKLFFIPCLFLFISLHDFITKTPVNWLLIVIFTAGLFCGIIFGYGQYKCLKIEVDQNKKLVKVNGGWFSFTLIVVTFTFKYYVGYTFATKLNITLANMSLLLFISNILTGMFIGRLLFALYKLKYGPNTNLNNMITL